MQQNKLSKLVAIDEVETVIDFLSSNFGTRGGLAELCIRIIRDGALVQALVPEELINSKELNFDAGWGRNTTTTTNWLANRLNRVSAGISSTVIIQDVWMMLSDYNDYDVSSLIDLSTFKECPYFSITGDHFEPFVVQSLLNSSPSHVAPLAIVPTVLTFENQNLPRLPNRLPEDFFSEVSEFYIRAFDGESLLIVNPR